jgi:Protein  of unknown function (DUF3018)
MATSRGAGLAGDEVLAYRGRALQRGLRPIQIRTPDARAPALKAQAHRRSLAVAGSPQAGDDRRVMDVALQPCPE